MVTRLLARDLWFVTFSYLTETQLGQMLKWAVVRRYLDSLSPHCRNFYDAVIHSFKHRECCPSWNIEHGSCSDQDSASASSTQEGWVAQVRWCVIPLSHKIIVMKSRGLGTELWVLSEVRIINNQLQLGHSTKFDENRTQNIAFTNEFDDFLLMDASPDPCNDDFDESSNGDLRSCLVMNQDCNLVSKSLKDMIDPSERIFSSSLDFAWQLQLRDSQYGPRVRHLLSSHGLLPLQMIAFHFQDSTLLNTLPNDLAISESKLHAVLHDYELRESVLRSVLLFGPASEQEDIILAPRPRSLPDESMVADAFLVSPEIILVQSQNDLYLYHVDYPNPFAQFSNHFPDRQLGRPRFCIHPLIPWILWQATLLDSQTSKAHLELSLINLETHAIRKTVCSALFARVGTILGLHVAPMKNAITVFVDNDGDDLQLCVFRGCS